MKYATVVTIDAPREKVIEVMDNPDNLPKWLKGLKAYRTITGTPGEVGAVAAMNFDMDGRKIKMTETITEKDLPTLFKATYRAPGIYNEQENFFKELPNGKTEWESHSFYKFSGAMSLVSWALRSRMKKQSLEFMENFKYLVENGTQKWKESA